MKTIALDRNHRLAFIWGPWVGDARLTLPTHGFSH